MSVFYFHIQILFIFAKYTKASLEEKDFFFPIKEDSWPSGKRMFNLGEEVHCVGTLFKAMSNNC